MLRVTVQDLADVTVFRCAGRIAFGYQDRLLTAFSKHPALRVAVLDLAEVTSIDAAGLGLLVSFRKWARVRAVVLKLMNLPPTVEDLLELTRLRSAFEICSVREMLDLLCRSWDQSLFAGVGATIESPLKVFEETEHGPCTRIVAPRGPRARRDSRYRELGSHEELSFLPSGAR